MIYAPYDSDGYAILLKCIAPETIQQMRSTVSVQDLRQRKPDLMGST